jgi:hypothetical protein
MTTEEISILTEDYPSIAVGNGANQVVGAAIEAAGHPAGSSCRDGINPLNSGKMGGIFKHRRNVFSLKIR